MRLLEPPLEQLESLQIDCSVYKQKPEIDSSNIDLLCTCIANAVRRLAGLTSGSICKFIKQKNIDKQTIYFLPSGVAILLSGNLVSTRICWSH